jgi:hypothetical protein
MTATIQRTSAQDLYRQISPAMTTRAYERGESLSAFLERESPSYEEKDGLDTFERMLMIAGIKTRNLPSLGVWADKGDVFFRGKDEADTVARRTLFHEWAARQWRGVAMGNVNTRAMYSSGDSTVNSSLRPYADAAQAYESRRIAPQIPVSELVAEVTPIDSDAYRKVYIEDDASEQRMVRVPEGAEIPGAKLTTSEQTVRLHKYGRKLTVTYEQMRRMRINMIARHIAKMAIQAEVDKVATIVDVLVNGDGNSGTSAEVFNLTDLDSAATAGTLTLKAWLAFKKKFLNPYRLTTFLARDGVTTDVEMLDAGTANILLATLAGVGNFGNIRPINATADAVRYGWTGDAPALKIAGFDRDWAIERVVEIGSQVSEIARFITNQTEVMTLSEVDGYAALDPEASKVLDINA